MRRLVSLTTVALVLGSSVALAAPAQAHGGKEDRERMRLEGLSEPDGTPVLSDNVDHLGNIPGQVGIAGCFMQTDEIFVTSGLESVRVYDVSDGTNPTEVGVLPQAVFENEAMNCGEIVVDGELRRFALIGVDFYQAAPDDPEHVNSGDGQELVMVEVTDPTTPTIVGRGPSTTSTHTVTCVVDSNCRYAYTAGGDGRFSILDLRDPENPQEVDANPRKDGVQPFRSPTAAHKWNFTNTDTGIHTGFGGTSIWDVSRPRDPRLMITTGKAGRGEAPKFEGYNDFIHHNANWANSDAFKPRSRPSTKNGNLLLITEEDYVERDCSRAGSFQTWWIKRLKDRKGPEIVPLDKVELTDLQDEQPDTVPTPTTSICSAHWFDRRAGDLVAIGYYGGGTQFLDTSNPRDIASHGYAYWGGTQVWDTRFVPLYKDGTQTKRKSNVAYAIDLVRGLDVYTVDVGDGQGTQPTAGVRPETTATDRAASAMMPLGLVALALGVVVAVRRRGRES